MAGSKPGFLNVIHRASPAICERLSIQNNLGLLLHDSSSYAAFAGPHHLSKAISLVAGHGVDELRCRNYPPLEDTVNADGIER